MLSSTKSFKRGALGALLRPKAKERKRRSNPIFHNVGKQGRKSGIYPNHAVSKDEDGFDNIDEFFAAGVVDDDSHDNEQQNATQQQDTSELAILEVPKSAMTPAARALGNRARTKARRTMFTKDEIESYAKEAIKCKRGEKRVRDKSVNGTVSTAETPEETTQRRSSSRRPPPRTQEWNNTLKSHAHTHTRPYEHDQPHASTSTPNLHLLDPALHGKGKAVLPGNKQGGRQRVGAANKSLILDHSAIRVESEGAALHGEAAMHEALENNETANENGFINSAANDKRYTNSSADGDGQYRSGEPLSHDNDMSGVGDSSILSHAQESRDNDSVLTVVQQSGRATPHQQSQALGISMDLGDSSQLNNHPGDTSVIVSARSRHADDTAQSMSPGPGLGDMGADDYGGSANEKYYINNTHDDTEVSGARIGLDLSLVADTSADIGDRRGQSQKFAPRRYQTTGSGDMSVEAQNLDQSSTNNSYALTTRQRPRQTNSDLMEIDTDRLLAGDYDGDSDSGPDMDRTFHLNKSILDADGNILEDSDDYELRVDDRAKAIDESFMLEIGDKGRQLIAQSDEKGPRRSKRKHVHPLKYWKQERQITKKRRSGTVDVTAIVHNDDPQTAEKKLVKRKSLGTELRQAGFSSRSNPKILVKEGTHQVPRDIAKTGQMVHLESLEDDVPGTEIAQVLRADHFTSGLFHISPNSLKPNCNVGPDTTLVFHVLAGRVTVTVNRTSFVMSRGCHFYVPKGNQYSLANNETRSTVKMLYTQIRGDTVDEASGTDRSNFD